MQTDVQLANIEHIYVRQFDKYKSETDNGCLILTLKCLFFKRVTLDEISGASDILHFIRYIPIDILPRYDEGHRYASALIYKLWFDSAKHLDILIDGSWFSNFNWNSLSNYENSVLLSSSASAEYMIESKLAILLNKIN